MPDHGCRNFFCLIVAAGNDATRCSIAAGLHAHCHQPELLDQIRSGAVDETTATATRDCDMHVKTVKQGDKVLCRFLSGNRDATAFDDPVRVNLVRTPNKHLAFGQGGPHHCLGLWRARLEVRVLFQDLARRIHRIEPAGPHKFLRTNFVGGIRSLPVTVAKARRKGPNPAPSFRRKYSTGGPGDVKSPGPAVTTGRPG